MKKGIQKGQTVTPRRSIQLGQTTYDYAGHEHVNRSRYALSVPHTAIAASNRGRRILIEGDGNLAWVDADELD